MGKHMLSASLLMIVLVLLVLVGRHAAADAPNPNVNATLSPDMSVNGSNLDTDSARRTKIVADRAERQWLEHLAEKKARKERATLDAGLERRTKIAVGPNANAVLSLDLITDGGAGNLIDDGVTSGVVSGQGTKIAVEVFAKGVTTPLSGVKILFDFDASVLTLDKVESSAFALTIPEATGANFAATTPVTLPSSGFLARAEFSTVADVTNKEFTLSTKQVTLAESAVLSDAITTTNAISFNAMISPDFDGDGAVGFADFLAFVGQFGARQGDGTYEAQYDLDSDGAIGFSDFLIFSSRFGQQVSPSNGGSSGGSGTPPTSTPFDLHRDNEYPEGITYANNRFYVVDGGDFSTEGDEKVYAYTSSGQRDASADFDLHRDNGRPGGITYANDRLYVADVADDKVYAYTSSGQRDASADFDLGNIIIAYGITYANNRFYVVDGFYEKVYAYTSSGQRDASADFDLHRESKDPEGITYANDRLYVVDGTDEKVYVYTSSGQHDASADFDLDSNNIIAGGITYANNRFYVVDWLDKVYVYTSSGQSGSGGEPPPSTSFYLDSDNGSPDGITYANNRLYVVDRKVYAYTSSGQHDASADFDLDSNNSIAYGITYANDRFYVVDGSDDKVYAYTSSGQHDASADFDLDSNNGRPVGITYANDRFYVVDSGDDVYAYTSSGQHDASAAFHLHRDNGYPEGITYANDRFYVVDWIREKVYAYTSSGQRDASADFDLHRDNNYPGGITYANNRLYVVDPDDEKVYVYTSSGQSGSGGGGGSSSPDLIVESPSVSNSTLTTGQSFTLSATVRNQGMGSSASTTLRYYRSSDATISTSDTEAGTDTVNGLSASGSSTESISLNAPSSAGTYYYGACVESVSGESDTNNNCSTGVRVTVSSGSSGGGSLGRCQAGMVVSPNQSCTVSDGEFRNIGDGCFVYTPIAPFGSDGICVSSFNLNGFMGTRVGNDFRIDVVP